VRWKKREGRRRSGKVVERAPIGNRLEADFDENVSGIEHVNV
jgi:hypothetical protein